MLSFLYCIIFLPVRGGMLAGLPRGYLSFYECFTIVKNEWPLCGQVHMPVLNI